VNGTSAYVGLSVPLPLFDRGQGPIARTTAEVTAADLELRAGLAEARADVESAAAALARRRDALAAFERTVGDRVPPLRRMAADAYREGSADILELIDANRSVREIELARVEQLEAVDLAAAQVTAAAALDEAEVPAAP
jgi:cobalt-zinc-cadmium efflux system outer membrane protein